MKLSASSIALAVIVILQLSTLLAAVGPGGCEEGLVDGGPGDVMATDVSYSDLGGDDEPVLFTNMSQQAGLDGFGGSYFAWGDYDGDGYQDLLVNGRRLLRNSGPPGWTFTDTTASSGLDQTTRVNVGIWGDYDNDGDLDVYLAGGGWTTSTPTRDDYLFRNEGDGTFVDVTAIAGDPVDDYPSTAAAWGDIDDDGYLDLYVANYESESYTGYPDSLWHNEGDGTFTDWSSTSGIRSAGPEPGRGVAFCDFDEDGDVDIHVSNYRIRPNFLWQNDGSGHFTNVAQAKGVTGDALYYQGYGPYYGHTIGSSWADWNNDGHMDLWEANLVHKYVGGGDIRGYICDDSKFYASDGPPTWTFTDVRSATGIPTKPVGGMGTYIGDELYDGIAWADFDNDGDLDVFMPQVYDLDYAYSYLYVNRGDGTFDDVGQSLGLRVWNTYGAAWADYDNDGDLDLVTGGKNPSWAPSRIHLFANSGNSNSWLKVKVEGTASNAMGLGTRVTVTAGNTTMTRDFEGGTGSHAQMNDLPVEFGLGRAPRADLVRVEFPSGNVMSYVNVDGNTTLVVREVPRVEDVTIYVSDAMPDEDEEVTLNTSAVAATGGPFTGYEWDTDGDGTFETHTDGPRVNVSWEKTTLYQPRLAVAKFIEGQGYYVISEPVSVAVRNALPVAVTETNVTIGEDEVRTLDASASYDTPSDMPTLMFQWWVDGVEGEWSRDPTTNVSWPESGEHIVTLLVRDDDGSYDSVRVYVTVVNRAPVVLDPGDLTVSEDEQVLISTHALDSAVDMLTLRYRIVFGDGNATGWIPEARRNYVYTTSGVMAVRVDAKDSDGAIGSVTFNITVINVEPTCLMEVELPELSEDQEFTVVGEATDSLSDMEALRWRYDYGDGNATQWRRRPIQATTHSYPRAGTYTVTLTVVDDDGATCNASGVVTVANRAPGMTVTGPTSQVAEDEEVELVAEGSDTASDALALEYRWDLGDGTVIDWSSTVEVDHAYVDAGTYTVDVRVRDDDGEEYQVFFPVKVENSPPVAEGTQSATIVDEGERVTFDATGSRDTPSDMGTLTVEWSWGSVTREGWTTAFNFTSEGSVTVILTVTDDDGAMSQLFFGISVRNVPPEGVATVDRTEAGVGDLFNFAAQGLTDTPNDVGDLTVTWSMGDGTVLTGVTVSHKYDEAGDYTVTMTVRDDDGAVKEAFTYVTVTEETGIMSGGGAMVAIVVAVLVAVLLVALLLFLRRTRADEGVEQPGETPVGEAQVLGTEEDPGVEVDGEVEDPVASDSERQL